LYAIGAYCVNLPGPALLPRFAAPDPQHWQPPAPDLPFLRQWRRLSMDEYTVSASSSLSIGLVGYGEVGRIFASELVARGVARVTAWDILLADPATAAPMKTHAAQA